MNLSEQFTALVRELVAETLLSERKKKGKPGGPRTRLGALRQLHPGEFAVTVKGAVDSAKGDVSDAAKNLDVSDRTLYDYLNKVRALRGVMTTQDREEAAEEKRKEKEEKEKAKK